MQVGSHMLIIFCQFLLHTIFIFIFAYILVPTLVSAELETVISYRKEMVYILMQDQFFCNNFKHFFFIKFYPEELHLEIIDDKLFC
jgi:hypothetical protein